MARVKEETRKFQEGLANEAAKKSPAPMSSPSPASPPSNSGQPQGGAKLPVKAPPVRSPVDDPLGALVPQSQEPRVANTSQGVSSSSSQEPVHSASAAATSSASAESGGAATSGGTSSSPPNPPAPPSRQSQGTQDQELADEDNENIVTTEKIQ